MRGPQETPVIAGLTYYQIGRAADDVAAVMAPEDFYGVGQWYEVFSQTTDEEVANFSRKQVPERNR
jgi:putative phosphoribosyl transferase